MIVEPVAVSSAPPAGGGILPGSVASGTAPLLDGRNEDGRNEVAGQIERAYPGYHVWTSDAGWWYATRMRPWARGQSATVHGPGPGELSGALAEEEAVTLGRAMTGAW
jgi:hypothetical protein